jgi:hypothetical protein
MVSCTLVTVRLVPSTASVTGIVWRCRRLVCPPRPGRR